MSLHFFHAGQARRSTLRALFVLVASVPAAALHAQSSTESSTQSSTQSATPSDTTTRRQSHMLAPMVVTAAREAPAEESLLGRVLRVDREHRQVVDLMAGNHKLAAYVNWQGREITRLETRLTYLKTTVTDSINRATWAADSATADVRTRREAVEARLAELEGRQMAGRIREPAAVGSFR